MIKSLILFLFYFKTFILSLLKKDIIKSFIINLRDNINNFISNDLCKIKIS